MPSPFSCFNFKKVLKIKKKTVKQKFSLPYSWIEYLLSASPPWHQLQLMQCCKQLRDRHRLLLKDGGYSVKEVEIIQHFLDQNLTFTKKGFVLGSFSDDHFCYKDNYQCYKELAPIKMEKLRIRVQHFLLFLQIFDLSILRELYVVTYGPKMNDIVPFLVESLEILDVRFVQNENILNYALENLPSITSFRFSWQDDITSLSDASEIARTAKLKHISITEITTYLEASEIAEFIIAQMDRNSSRIELYFDVNIDNCTKEDVEEFLKETDFRNVKVAINGFSSKSQPSSPSNAELKVLSLNSTTQ